MTLQSMFSGTNGSINSTYRESVTTFNFISDLMKALAKRNKKLDVLMTKSGDSFGYDVILHCDGITKYVQLKTKENKTRTWNIHNSLIHNKEGVLIVIYLNFPSENDWEFEYRIWNSEKIPDVTLFEGKTQIVETMLEEKRDIDMLSVYLFPEHGFEIGVR